VEDILVGNGVASGFSGSSSTSYTTTITPATDGLVTVDILDLAANNDDRIGTSGTTAAAVQYRVTADLPLTPTIAGPGGPVTGAFPITITFSKAASWTPNPLRT